MNKPDLLTQEKDIEEQKRIAERERPLTREQRRIHERVNREVQEVFDQLSREFFTFFMSSDPEGIEVQDKMKQLDAKWRVYCKRKKLLPKGFPMLKAYCEALIQEYKTEKA